MTIRHPPAIALATTALAASLGAAPAAKPVSGVERQHVDAGVRAQDDFYAHANGRWLAQTPIPPDKAFIGAFEQIAETTQAQLRTLIEQSAGTDTREARQIATLYAGFMDEAALERLGVQPLEAELAAIDAVAAPAQLGALFARHARLGVPTPLALVVRQDARDPGRTLLHLYQHGLGLPDRDYYLLADDLRFQEMRAQYLAYLERLLALAGEPRADDAARAVLALETELAVAQWTRVENRDPVRTYNPADAARLRDLAPAVDWAAWLAPLGPDATVVVVQPSYVSGVGAQLEATPLAAWKAYAKARLLGAYAPLLGREFVDTQFAFAGGVLRGTPENLPRWKRGVALVEQSLGDALGQLYVARHFPPAHQARMEALVAQLVAAYRDSIATLDWMGPDTKREAQAKLAALALKIGAPRRWIDYAALDIRPGDLVGNVMRARAFEHARQRAKLDRPVDRDEWLMTPQTVNAYYNPALNEIVFPASILQPPFFDARADDAVNYGAIGAVIGHEISHAFDDQGSQYDGQGLLRNWWRDDDRERFAARTRRLVAQYGAYQPLPGYALNGEQTLGENIADNSGLAIAWKAWQRALGGKPSPRIDGLRGEERFFYGWAQVWRGKMREARLVEQIKAGVHAPNPVRGNGPLRNHPAYYTTFGVRPGDRMYLPPEQRVSIW